MAALLGELGVDLPEEDLADTLGRLDPQRTGGVSFGDFEDWWKSWTRKQAAGSANGSGLSQTSSSTSSSMAKKNLGGKSEVRGQRRGPVKASLGGGLALVLAADASIEAAKATEAAGLSKPPKFDRV